MFGKMQILPFILCFFALTGVTQGAPVYDHEPPMGTLQLGATVYVDDGTCGSQIKKVVGGRVKHGIQRVVLCVERPGGLGHATAPPTRHLYSGKRTCQAVLTACLSSADPRYAGGCYAYYNEAKNTGRWPAFGTKPAFACH